MKKACRCLLKEVAECGWWLDSSLVNTCYQQSHSSCTEH